jgi:hypothetical protein
MLRNCFASLRSVPAPFATSCSRRPSALALIALGLLIVALGHSAVAAPEARAEGCGPGALGRATAWKDRNAIYDFVDACDWHDRCYGARGYGWDPATAPGRSVIPYPRDWCDSGFRHGMRASCSRKPAGSRTAPLCRVVTEVFYSLVRAFGGSWYRRADGHRTLLRLSWPA